MSGFPGTSGVPKKYVDDLVAQSTAIVTTTKTGTTDANGVLITDLSRDAYIVLFASSGGAMIVPFVQAASDGGKIGAKCMYPTTGNAIANTSVTVTFYLKSR